MGISQKWVNIPKKFVFASLALLLAANLLQIPASAITAPNPVETAQIIAKSESSFTIIWNSPSVGVEAISSYDIRYSKDGGKNWTSVSYDVTVPEAPVQYRNEITNLASGKYYDVQIRSVGNGFSDWLRVENMTSLQYSQIEVGPGYTCGITLEKKIACWGKIGYLMRFTVGNKLFTINPENSFISANIQSQRTVNPIILEDTRNVTKIVNSPDQSTFCFLMEEKTIDCRSLFPGFSDVSTFRGVVDISVGTFGGCVVFDSNEIKCWLSVQNDQIEIPNLNGLSGISKLDANADPYQGCAITLLSEVVCWGYNDETGNIKSNTERVPGISDAVQVSQQCAVLSTETVKCWGLQNLGSGFEYFSEPQLRPHLTSINKIDRSCALKTNGKVLCWSSGFLGNGTLNSWEFREPVEVLTDENSLLTDIVDVSRNNEHACAVKSDFTNYCWGVGNSVVWGWDNNHVYTTDLPYAMGWPWATQKLYLENTESIEKSVKPTGPNRMIFDGVFKDGKKYLYWSGITSTGSVISKVEYRFKEKSKKTWNKWINTKLKSYVQVKTWNMKKQYQVQVRLTNNKGTVTSKIFTFSKIKNGWECVDLE